MILQSSLIIKRIKRNDLEFMVFWQNYWYKYHNWSYAGGLTI